MSSEHVNVERRDNVTVIHLDDGKVNALSFSIIEAITAAVDEAAADESTTGVVIHGRPGKFSAGFDLNVMRGDDVSAIVKLVSDGGNLVRHLYAAPVPIVGACTGHAIAAGSLMLMGCDVRVGADIPCKIGLNEVAIGMVLPDWAITISKDRISKRHLQRSLATAHLVDAAGAVDVGLLDEVVAEDQVLDVAVQHAADFAELNRTAYAGTVEAVRGEVLETMAAQIQSDRDRGQAVTV